MRLVYIPSFVVFVVIFFAGNLFAKVQSKFDYLSFSVGSWIVTNDNTGSSSKDSYFQSAKVYTAYHIGPVKGTISIPLAFTLERYQDRVLYSVYPGNQEMTFGVSVGKVQPRVGISFPMGYPLRNTAWIGSGNINGLAGLGFKIGSFRRGSIQIGGEALSRVALTDTSSGARLGRGAVSGYLSVKTSFTQGKWQAGFDTFLSGFYYPYTDWGGSDQGFGFVPSISVKRSLGSGRGISLKFGAGPGWAGENLERRQLNVSAGIAFDTGL